MKEDTQIFIFIITFLLVIVGSIVGGITLTDKTQAEVVKTCIESGGSPTVNQHGTLTNCEQ